MKKTLKEFEHNGEKYEIILEKNRDGFFIIKDFNKEAPFSPFYYCVNDLGFIDINEIENKLNQPMLNLLISQLEDSVRYWADNKFRILGYIPS